MSTKVLETLELGEQGILLVEFYILDGLILRINLKKGKRGIKGDKKRFSPFLKKALTQKSPNLSRLPYKVTGTPFQKRVWEEVRKIPPGTTMTYGQVAKALDTSSPRAIGQALKQNPLPIIIPCHRVIGKGGSLTGFSAGLEIKRMLLNFEKGLKVHEDSSNE